MTLWAGILGMAVSLLLILPAIAVVLRRADGKADHDEDEDDSEE